MVLAELFLFLLLALLLDPVAIGTAAADAETTALDKALIVCGAEQGLYFLFNRFDQSTIISFMCAGRPSCSSIISTNLGPE